MPFSTAPFPSCAPFLCAPTLPTDPAQHSHGLLDLLMMCS